MTKNQLQYWADKEVARSNLAKEAETQRNNMARLEEERRHNLETEAISKENIKIAQMNLNELNRSNQAREAENTRSNTANESIRRDSNAIGFSQLGETITHNRASEANNLILANISAQRASEEARSNRVHESITNIHNANQDAINAMNASTRIKELENTQRYQEQSLKQQKLNTIVNAGSNIIGALTGALGRYAAITQSSKTKLKK